MLSSRLAFFLCILTLLFADFLWLPWTATAPIQSDSIDKPPYPRICAKCFYRLWASTGPGGCRHRKRCAIQTDNRHPTQPKDVFRVWWHAWNCSQQRSFSASTNIVISEIMWGLDTGSPLDAHDPYTQWIELYNPHVGAHITAHLFLLFTPFENYPDRDTIELPNGVQARVLDAVSNLHLGRWNLPGKSGRRPLSSVISAYRDIVYPEGGTGQSDVPFGSYQKSWKATAAHGRRNTLLSIIDNRGRVIGLPYIATPGTPHVPDSFLRPLPKTVVRFGPSGYQRDSQRYLARQP